MEIFHSAIRSNIHSLCPARELHMSKKKDLKMMGYQKLLKYRAHEKVKLKRKTFPENPTLLM